jgi:Ca-activated chloride channel family protein
VRRWTTILGLWLAGSLPVGAQDPPHQVGTAGVATFRSSVEVVTLSVTVTDGDGRHVTGLNQGDFEVLDDGQPQQVRFFAALNIPLDVILLIDTSSSMRGKIEMVQAAAHGFVKTLRPGDRGAVVSFNSAVRVLQGFTGERALLDSAIDSTQIGGGTALYTGIYVSLDHFSRLGKQAGELRKSAVVLLSDGEDTGSLLSADDLLERARRAGVPIYPISVQTEAERTALSLSNQQRLSSGADYTLRTLARETGAMAFFPATLADLSGVYGKIAGELAAQYTLGYVPAVSPADGTFRRVLVRIPARPEAKPRTRAGYYSTGSGRAAR